MFQLYMSVGNTNFVHIAENFLTAGLSEMLARPHPVRPK